MADPLCYSRTHKKFFRTLLCWSAFLRSTSLQLSIYQTLCIYDFMNLFYFESLLLRLRAYVPEIYQSYVFPCLCALVTAQFRLPTSLNSKFSMASPFEPRPFLTSRIMFLSLNVSTAFLPFLPRVFWKHRHAVPEPSSCLLIRPFLSLPVPSSIRYSLPLFLLFFLCSFLPPLWNSIHVLLCFSFSLPLCRSFYPYLCPSLPSPFLTSANQHLCPSLNSFGCHLIQNISVALRAANNMCPTLTFKNC